MISVIFFAFKKIPHRIILLSLAVLLLQACGQSQKDEASKSETLLLTHPTPPSPRSTPTPHKKNSLQDSLMDAITYLEDPALIKALVKRGADVNKKDEYLFYPLYWAQYEIQYKQEKDSTIINTLLQLGAIDYNEKVSPFFDLCKRGNLDSVKLVVNQGQDVNAHRIWYDPAEEDASCYCYETPLSASIKSGNYSLVKFLIDQGAEINLDVNGVQPLSVALQEKQYAIADLLILNKAVKENTFALADPFYYYGAEDTVYIDYLLKHHIPYEDFDWMESPFRAAANTGNLAVLKRFIPITTLEEKNSALCRATTVKAAELLLKNGAHVNSTSSFFGEGGCQYFRTPLTTAVETGNLDYIKFLIERGANVNFLDQYMKENESEHAYGRCDIESPLTIAVLNEKEDIVRFLIGQGANVNFIMKNQWEETSISPLIAAVQKNNVVLAKMLLTKGAKVVNNGVSAHDYVVPPSVAIVDALNKAK